jgi:hypothetical protein
MAYFAQINNNIVQRVISISNEIVPDPAPENEAFGQQYIADTLGLEGTWLQCSYNANFRGCYPGPGYSYDPSNDIFVAPVIDDSEPIDETE